MVVDHETPTPLANVNVYILNATILSSRHELRKRKNFECVAGYGQEKETYHITIDIRHLFRRSTRSPPQ